jgi:hypothetical protein
MSSLWREIPGEGWRAFPIAKEAGEGELCLADEGIRLIVLANGPERGVGLLAESGAAVRVNGQPVLGGFRVLEHRDEILAGRTRLFFSAESTPVQVVHRLQPGMRPPTCPTCRGKIQDGDQAVQCPRTSCRLWYHQGATAAQGKVKTCWTYGPTCRSCQHPTALSAEPIWRPEMEEAHV